MTRAELATALRLAFLSASGHADGWDAVAEAAEQYADRRVAEASYRQSEINTGNIIRAQRAAGTS
jgi:hypothetical protein